jgi:hypothetical protein
MHILVGLVIRSFSTRGLVLIYGCPCRLNVVFTCMRAGPGNTALIGLHPNPEGYPHLAHTPRGLIFKAYKGVKGVSETIKKPS